jgi:alkanesulfonate monooxygenase SsuD/methylene tetrahydromethanopterin reductase-like flavin-dependent oxidoreductase (luciferase family)
MSIEAVAAIAPDDAALPGTRALAEKRFGASGFGLHDTDLIGTPPQIAERLAGLVELGFGQIVLFTHDRASDETLHLLATEIIPALPGA